MKRPNTDRMRRVIERDRQGREARDAELWLASLTPEHRSIHARGLPCGECIAAGLRSFRESIDRLREEHRA